MWPFVPELDLPAALSSGRAAAQRVARSGSVHDGCGAGPGRQPKTAGHKWSPKIQRDGWATLKKPLSSATSPLLQRSRTENRSIASTKIHLQPRPCRGRRPDRARDRSTRTFARTTTNPQIKKTFFETRDDDCRY